MTPDSRPAPDSPPPADAPPDSPPSGFTKPVAFAVPLSSGGHDQLQSATRGPNGSFYVAGFAGAAVDGERRVVVAQIKADGSLDTSFGTAGVVTTSIVYVGAADEVDVATQSDGKIIVSATVANATDPTDRDIAVLRLTATGVPDATFGTANGVAIISVTTALATPAPIQRDVSRGLAVDTNNNIYLHAASFGGITTGATPAQHSDFWVVKLTPTGAIDTTWGTGNSGKVQVDIGESNATVRGIVALPNGSVIAGGYASLPGIAAGPHPVVYKLTPAGALDAAFAEGGVFADAVLAQQTEVYNIALHGTHFTTAGYGRPTAEPNINQWISLRFDATTGARDTAWGGATLGAVIFNPSALSSNCRNALALPGGKTLMVGSTGPGNMATQDAAWAILDATGKLDTAFAGTSHVYELGNNGADQFWGGAVSGTKAIVVGYKGTVGTASATNNDDAFAVIVPLE